MGQVKKSEGTKVRDEISATFFLFYIQQRTNTKPERIAKKINHRVTQCRSFDTGILFLQPEPLGNKNDQ